MGAAELSAREAALAPPRAYGAPPASGVLRAEPEDFVVEEELGFAPAGNGTHLLLKVRKRNANTQWVARELTRLAGCRTADAGYAGLKDRRAVAVQWFSVPRPRTAVDWREPRSAEFEVLEVHEHTRKLPRGALAELGTLTILRANAHRGSRRSGSVGCRTTSASSASAATPATCSASVRPCTACHETNAASCSPPPAV